jgi:hypothetical protein
MMIITTTWNGEHLKIIVSPRLVKLFDSSKGEFQLEKFIISSVTTTLGFHHPRFLTIHEMGYAGYGGRFSKRCLLQLVNWDVFCVSDRDGKAVILFNSSLESPPTNVLHQFTKEDTLRN